MKAIIGFEKGQTKGFKEDGGAYIKVGGFYEELGYNEEKPGFDSCNEEEPTSKSIEYLPPNSPSIGSKFVMDSLLSTGHDSNFPSAPLRAT